MTGPSTMAHHHELHDKIAALEARVAELEKEKREARTVSFRVAENLMRIALGAPCECVPNGEACLGHEFISIWYQEKGALKDADPDRVIEHMVTQENLVQEARSRAKKEAPLQYGEPNVNETDEASST